MTSVKMSRAAARSASGAMSMSAPFFSRASASGELQRWKRDQMATSADADTARQGSWSADASGATPRSAPSRPSASAAERRSSSEPLRSRLAAESTSAVPGASLACRNVNGGGGGVGKEASIYILSSGMSREWPCRGLAGPCLDGRP